MNNNYTYKCRMPEDINDCPYFIPENSICSCSAPQCNQCIPLEIDKKQYKREPRWYEKYYK